MIEPKIWYKRKYYKHFDYPLSESRANSFVSKPENIKRHKFSPLIHYEKQSRRVRKRKESERNSKFDNRLVIKIKTREIFYASHWDGYIYSYYNKILGEFYEKILQNESLTDSVIAYRSVKKGYCNIHFSRDVFSFIGSQTKCAVVCVDISGFFDNLDVEILKRNWKLTLNSDHLPDDHYAVYKNLCNFTYVEEKDILKYFNINPRKEDNDQSPKAKICAYAELRRKHQEAKNNNSKLIKNKSDLKIKGIPQGTAISGMLSNIFMIDFDKKLESYAKNLNGIYRRYSDDIIICIPNFDDLTKLEKFVEETLKHESNDSLSLNPKKTEKRLFKNETGLPMITDESGKIKKIQYLGVEFDGQSIVLRNSTISKAIGKITQYIHHKKKNASSYKFKSKINGNYKIDRHEIMSNKTLIGLKLRKTQQTKINKSNFVTYALRFSSISFGNKLNNANVKKQIVKIDKYVLKKIK